VLRSIGKAVRTIVGGFPLMHELEKRYVKNIQFSDQVKPIFIVGLPRSGTTLLYQLLTYYFNVCYFSNFSSIFFKFPVIISKVIKPFIKKKNKIKKSNYGLIPGLWSPSEAGAIFRFWFDDNSWDYEKKCLIRNSIHKMSCIYNAPFVNKNVYNSQRLKRITEVFPNAFIINMNRNLVYNIQSILIGMKKGVIPPSSIGIVSNFDFRAEDSTIKISKKIIDFRHKIERFFKENSYLSYINVNYEDLCDDNFKVMNFIKESYEDGETKLIFKNTSKLTVTNFNKKRLPKIEWNKINNIVRNQ